MVNIHSCFTRESFHEGFCGPLKFRHMTFGAPKVEVCGLLGTRGGDCGGERHRHPKGQRPATECGRHWGVIGVIYMYIYTYTYTDSGKEKGNYTPGN